MTFIGEAGLSRRATRKDYVGYLSRDGRWDVSGRILEQDGIFFVDYNGAPIAIKNGGKLKDRFSSYTVSL